MRESAARPDNEQVPTNVRSDYGPGAIYTIKDSGERQQFASGMVRDTTTGKLDWWRLLVGPMAERLVAHVTKGAVKYPDVKPGVPNWTLAVSYPEYARFKDSAFRHFVQWMQGDVDEDHAAAVLFNINGAEYVKARLGGLIIRDPPTRSA